MEHEKAAFAARLRAVLEAAGIEASAAVVEKRFNSRYRGASVTVQAISSWLSGRYIPKQDKLRILGELTGVDPHVLQYGNAKGRVADARPDYSANAGARERRIIDAFLALPARRRELVGELVAALHEGKG